MSVGDEEGAWFSLSFCDRASSSCASFRRFVEDLGRDRRLARLVDDLVFFGLSGRDSFDLCVFSPSPLPANDFNDIVLNVFLCNDFPPSLLEDRFSFGLDGNGSGLLC